jgi:hypothetical protein
VVLLAANGGFYFSLDVNDSSVTLPSAGQYRSNYFKEALVSKKVAVDICNTFQVSQPQKRTFFALRFLSLKEHNNKSCVVRQCQKA